MSRGLERIWRSLNVVGIGEASPIPNMHLVAVPDGRSSLRSNVHKLGKQGLTFFANFGKGKAMSRVRNKEFNTIHHLTSRIAHQVYFLKEEEQNDFMSIVRRVSTFSGVELLGWCIMNNHFHLYVYLPVPPPLTDEEVLSRYHQLKGGASVLLADENWQNRSDLLCQLSSDRQEARAELIKAIRRRMYSIAEYMRMIKQWFTEAYNARNGHKGTLWEAPYGDSPLYWPESEDEYKTIRDRLGYVHLNPVRAAITNRYDGYAWSSYTAFKEGDPIAVKAMRRLYPEMEDAEIARVHELRLDWLLEDWKRKRADEIARKRLAGYEIPTDPLTDECKIAQAAAHAADVQKELEQLHAERDLVRGAKARRELIMRQIRTVLLIHPSFNAGEIASVIDVPRRTVYRYLESMRSSMPSAA